jgi:hypothetical protein
MSVNNKPAFSQLAAQEYNELIALARPLRADKTGNESTSSTTLQNDDHLFLSLESGAYYDIEGWLLVTAPAAQDLKLAWTTPTSPGGWWSVRNTALAATIGTVYQNSLTWAGSAILEGSAGDLIIELRGVIDTGSGAGTLQLQWAPNTAGSVTVQKYSTLLARKH